jgi:hypothetical protein
MQVVPFEVDDSFPSAVLHVGVADIPLLWYSPIEYLGSAGNFMHVQRDLFPYAPKRLAESFPGNTAAERIKLTDQ